MMMHAAPEVAQAGGRPPKPSELFRERQVARYYAALPTLVDFETATSGPPNTPAFVAKSSSDSTLTAFAQLAALRFNVARAMISLIDSRNQYVLAEATKTLSLRSDQRHGRHDALSLGTVVLPRSRSISELLLEPTQDAGSVDHDRDKVDILIIHNVQEHPRYQAIPKVPGTIELQFYAGVPIMLPDGTKIGVFSLLDDKPHPPLTSDQEFLLREMAKTTMDHLEAVRLRQEHQRRHKLVSGLESFIDGLGDLRSLSKETKSGGQHRPLDPSDRSQRARAPASVAPGSDMDTVNPLNETRPATTESTPLWERALPTGCKTMFSRAATIIRQAGDYDGVVFFYMSSTSSGRRSTRRNSMKFKSAQRSPSSSSSSTTPPVSPTISSVEPNSSGESPNPHSRATPSRSTSHSSYNPCPVLSASLSSDEAVAHATTDGFSSNFDQRDLRRLLGKRPQGWTFVFSQYGQPFPGDTSSSSSGVELLDQNYPPKYATTSPEGSDEMGARYRTKHSYVGSLQKLSRSARAFVCLPLWDFERQRWFAYAACWSNTLHRDPALEGDLHFLRLFGHSIMSILAHMDAIAVDRARTGFVSSISHELRSPLHGILGATSFLQDSSLDRFQREMVDSVSNSGRTLLDTIDHVMDFAKISSTFASDPKTAFPPDPGNSSYVAGSSLSSTIDIAAVLEEVLDAVSMGFSVQHDFVLPDEPTETSQSPSRNSKVKKSYARASRNIHKRGRVKIAVQISSRRSWYVETQAGAWRRIIMNLFANALKYTSDGLITVRLQSLNDDDSQPMSVRLSVVDTGKGMSDDYLENHLFQAFSQEDSFATGTGLGLNIVDQVVRALGGTVDVTSSKGVGSTIAVSLPMRAADVEPARSRNIDVLGSVVKRMRGLRICFVDDPKTPDVSGKVAVETEFSSSLSDMLKDWFEVDCTSASYWTPGSADIVLCAKPSFKHLDLIRSSAQGGHIPPVIIVASDPLEMAVLRTDARISTEGSIVALTCQPVGPRKLAKCLEQCIGWRQTQTPMPSKGEGETAPTSQPPGGLESSTSVNHSAPLQWPPTVSRASVEVNAVETNRGPAVLIVDDNPLNLRLLGAFMEKLALPYHKAANGQEAVDRYKSAHETIKYILMDISMPIMDGMTSTRCIREFEQASGLARTPIVALTGLTSTAARSEAAEAGMDDFLTKPVSFRTLRDKIPHFS